ncbi:ABC transporter permease [Bacteroidota bacterium]
MRTIRFLIIKEFKQIFRNKGMLPIIFVAPVIQLLILAYAATYEIKNLKLFLIDKDKSSYSTRLVEKFTQTDHFILSGQSNSEKDAYYSLDINESDLAIIIPQSFEKDLTTSRHAKVQFLINAIDGAKAGVGVSYAQIIINNYIEKINQDFSRKYVIMPQKGYTKPVLISTNSLNWYNEEMDYKTFMVPGILVLLVTLIGGFLSSMNIVREKEMGTIEQINVAPIRKHQFIIGKLFPFWILGLVELGVGLTIAKIFFNIPMVGSLPLLFGFASAYLLVILGIGLFISTITDTQQQSMFVTWFFLVIFILMSGLFTPIENMPVWAQNLTLINPLRYFIEVVRMVLLKGSGFMDIRWHLVIMLIFGILINTMAVIRYRKTIS